MYGVNIRATKRTKKERTDFAIVHLHKFDPITFKPRHLLVPAAEPEDEAVEDNDNVEKNEVLDEILFDLL